MEEKIDWLSITEYSIQTGVSISTIRRRIKAEKIDYQIIGGKYFIAHECESTEVPQEDLLLRLEVQKLRDQLSKQEEELIDLKMLVELYEGNDKNDTPPELPMM